jgi:hypothetical protein
MKNFTKYFLLLLLNICSISAFSLPKLSSFPSATATIYLDFDGHTVNSAYWNNGNPIICAAPALSDAQISEIFNRVSEDYRPFNINITTDSVKFLAAPLAQRMRVIITPTSGWRTGVGGIAYIGSFTWGDDTPAFVFSDRLGPNNAKYIAECCTHESGHTVGLSHQSSYDASCNLVETYNTGTGSGETGWAPVMGNSYYKNMTGWNDGPTPYGCANVQDNLTIITSTNGFTYRNDEYAETMDANTFNLQSNSFTIDGIITTNTDKDAFRFTLTQLSNFHIDAVPFNLGSNNTGANLDVKMMLYNSNQVLLRTYDPATTMAVTIDTSLPAGTYYLILDGTGNNYTDNYGSLGSYTITGFRSALPIRDVTLSGTASKNKHQLNWTIIADEPIKEQLIEYSKDGTSFRPLTLQSTTSRTHSYLPNNNQTIYYRLRVTSVVDQVVYSNIIALKNNAAGEQSFIVSTLVTNNITIRASEAYQYRLFDSNGRLVATGKGIQGVNNIQLNNQSAGMYILQLFGNNSQHTERILKQ